jgi:hypothetical protein
MRAEIQIPKDFQSSWKYLKKCKISPQYYILKGGLKEMYEASRECGYKNRKTDDFDIF